MSDHLGKISFLDVPDVNGIPVLLNAGTTPSIQTGTLAARPAFGTAGRLYVDTTSNLLYSDTGTAWITIGSTATATAAAPDRSVQFNNAGAFAGTSIMTWNPSNYLNIANGINTVPNLILGTPSTIPAAGLYIEVNTTAAMEGFRVYFNRGTGPVGGWILSEYDGATPYLRIQDEDDDPPYISFSTVNGGTFAAPAIASNFGLRGTTSNAASGFSWRIGGGATQGLASPEVMALDSQWLRLPSGSTAQRPTPVVGMTRYNTDLAAEEAYQANVWVQRTGVVDKSVVTTNTTLTAAAQTIISYTVPGGTLGTNNMIKMRICGTYANKSGGNRTLTFSFLYGGTTFFADTSANVVNNVIVGWNVDLILSSNNSIASQTLNGIINIGGTGPANTGITGDLATDETLSVAVITATGAVNSNNNQALVFSVNTNATGANTFSKYLHVFEVL